MADCFGPNEIDLYDDEEAPVCIQCAEEIVALERPTLPAIYKRIYTHVYGKDRAPKRNEFALAAACRITHEMGVMQVARIVYNEVIRDIGEDS